MTTYATVKDIMATNLLTLRPEDDIGSAVSMFLKNRISGAPVVDKAGRLVGVLSEKDCMRILLGSFFENDLRAEREVVGDFMTKTVKTISSTMNVVEVASLFHTTAYRRLPVVDGDALVGQVSRRDVLRAIDALLKDAPTVAPPSEMGSMITEGAHDVVGPATNRRFSS